MDRLYKFPIAAVFCWLLLPVILFAVTIMCLAVPFAALINPNWVKINGK